MNPAYTDPLENGTLLAHEHGHAGRSMHQPAASTPPSPKAKLWPAMRARPKMLACVIFGLVVFYSAHSALPLSSAAASLLAWNLAAVSYLALTWLDARQTTAADIQKRAIKFSPGRKFILVTVITGVGAVLFAVATQLALAKDMHGFARASHLALSGLTMLTAWLFTQAVFALHYAHDFYLERIHERPDPLQFPGTRDPMYADFFYFAAIIGTSGQTADVAFNGSALRPIGTLHCIISFFFNASVLALSINVLAGALF
ncbi:DUF1345 domain-containing protein [Ramlibacter sp. MMS24-I3-19]|uniref:DUF1345 domain-containing protein n=1 Tax=Ramlibacter sp. MMS24-I3-19 TaxID=3416606 RepID=UPI003D05983B